MYVILCTVNTNCPLNTFILVSTNPPPLSKFRHFWILSFFSWSTQNGVEVSLSDHHVHL